MLKKEIMVEKLYSLNGDECLQCEGSLCKNGYNVTFFNYNSMDGGNSDFLGCYNSLKEAKRAIKKDYMKNAPNPNHDPRFHKFYHTNYRVSYTKIVYSFLLKKK